MPRPTRPNAPVRLKQLRAAALILGLVAAVAFAWPHPGPDRLASANAEALRYLVGRYSSEHQGAIAQDLATVVAAAEEGGYNVRVKNPYSGVIASFDDPAIARPLALHHGDATEAGVVFYQAHADALGRIAWVIEVAGSEGALAKVAEGDLALTASR